MAHKKKTRSQVVSEMTDIIVSHLETMPPEERKERISAFKRAMSEKRDHARPKAASVSRTRPKFHRIPA
jgi:hypothetical protein